MPFSLSLYLLGLDVEAPMHDRAIEEIGKDWLTFTNLAEAAPGVTKQGVIVVLCSAGRKIMDGGSLKWVYNLSDLRNCIATLTTSFQLPAATFTEGCVLCLLDPLVFTGEGNGTNLDFQVHKQNRVLRVAGKVKFFGLCGARKGDGELCRMATDKNGGEYCFLHDRSRFQQYPVRARSAAAPAKPPAANKAAGGHTAAAAPDSAAAVAARIFSSLSGKPLPPQPGQPGKIVLSSRPTTAQMRAQPSALFNPRTGQNASISSLASFPHSAAPAGAAGGGGGGEGLGLKRPSSAVPMGAGATKRPAPGPSSSSSSSYSSSASAPPPPPATSSAPAQRSRDVLGEALAAPPVVPFSNSSSGSGKASAANKPGSSARGDGGSSMVSGQISSLEDHDLDQASEAAVGGERLTGHQARGANGAGGGAWGGRRDGAVNVPAPVDLGLKARQGQSQPLSSSGGPFRENSQTKPAVAPRPGKAEVRPQGATGLQCVDPKMPMQSLKMVGGVLLDVGNLFKQSAGAPAMAAKAAAAAAAAAKAPPKKPPVSAAMAAEIEGLLSRRSRHAGEAEDEWFDAYGSKLEQMAKKESKQDFANKQHALTVKAFFCRQCSVYTEGLSSLSLCKKQNHIIAPCQALKRFFACQQCKNVAYTLGHTHQQQQQQQQQQQGASSWLPKFSCNKCQSFRWVLCGYQGTATGAPLTEKLVLAASNYNDRNAGMDSFNARAGLLDGGGRD